MPEPLDYKSPDARDRPTADMITLTTMIVFGALGLITLVFVVGGWLLGD